MWRDKEFVTVINFHIKLLRKYSFLFLLTSPLSCSSKKSKLECSKLAAGQFHIKAKDNIPGFLIERNDSLQTEFNQSTGIITTLKIKWLDSCMYELVYLYEKKNDTLIPLGNTVRDSIQLIPWRAKILKTGDGYYVFEMVKKGIDMKFSDTMWVNYLVGGFKSIGDTFKIQH